MQKTVKAKDLRLGDVVSIYNINVRADLYGTVTEVTVHNVKVHYIEEQVYRVYSRKDNAVELTRHSNIFKGQIIPDKGIYGRIQNDGTIRFYEPVPSDPDGTLSKWDIRFYELAAHYASWSKDPSTKCGAVVAKGNVQVSSGYNGFPHGTSDAEDLLNNREQKYARVLHAELNAILYAKRDLTDHTIYVYPFMPCSQCMAAIIQSGMTRVVTNKPTGDLAQRWAFSNKEAADMAANAKVKIDFLPGRE